MAMTSDRTSANSPRDWKSNEHLTASSLARLLEDTEGLVSIAACQKPISNPQSDFQRTK